jgi:hypothetical protein
MFETVQVLTPGQLVATALHYVATQPNPGVFNLALIMQIISIALAAFKAIMDLLNTKLAELASAQAGPQLATP